MLKEKTMLKKKESCKDCCHCQVEERFDINKNRITKTLFCTKVLKGSRTEQSRNKLKIDTACEYFKHRKDSSKEHIKYGAVGVLAGVAASIFMGDIGILEVVGAFSGAYMGLNIWNYNKEKNNAKK